MALICSLYNDNSLILLHSCWHLLGAPEPGKSVNGINSLHSPLIFLQNGCPLTTVSAWRVQSEIKGLELRRGAAAITLAMTARTIDILPVEWHKNVATTINNRAFLRIRAVFIIGNRCGDN
jgi:hypothetical protein